MILITHNMEHVVELADRAVVLRQGRKVGELKPDGRTAGAGLHDRRRGRIAEFAALRSGEQWVAVARRPQNREEDAENAATCLDGSPWHSGGRLRPGRDDVKIGFITKFPVPFFATMEDAAKAYAAAHPGVEIVFGQGTSATDIEGQIALIESMVTAACRASP